MPEVSCKICGKAFYTKPNWIKLGWGKYCSRKCFHEAAKTGKKIACSVCNKETYKTHKALTRSKSGKFFCSKSCQTIWRNSMAYTGENHPNWKGGSFISYRDILTKNGSVQKCMICGIDDKRILAAHHIDNNHKNNDSANLTWLCHNCHYLVHHYKKEQRELKSILKT